MMQLAILAESMRPSSILGRELIKSGFPLSGMIAYFIVSAIVSCIAMQCTRKPTSVIISAIAAFILCALILPLFVTKMETYQATSGSWFKDPTYETREIINWGGVWIGATLGAFTAGSITVSFGK